MNKIVNEGIYQMPSPQTPSAKKANYPYCINPEKVMIVKKFLDGGFKRGNYETIGSNGLPNSVKIVAMMNSNGEVLKNMYMEQLQDLLIDHFKGMFSDHLERELFMKQVLSDWFDKKIGTFGTLSVNHL